MKLLSRVRLFPTPWTVAYQAPPSTGFSRQASWSGLPFPSPGDLPDPGIEVRPPALQADSLPAEPQRKLKNAGEGSLSLLQWIVPTQVLNWGLLHCRQILYQLSYQGSLYAEYIIWNARLNEAQAIINIARKNINNLRYADDPTIMAENEEELKSLLMKVKRESEKADLKLNIQKTKIMPSSPVT